MCVTNLWLNLSGPPFTTRSVYNIFTLSTRALWHLAPDLSYLVHLLRSNCYVRAASATFMIVRLRARATEFTGLNWRRRRRRASRRQQVWRHDSRTVNQLPNPYHNDSARLRSSRPITDPVPRDVDEIESPRGRATINPIILLLLIRFIDIDVVRVCSQLTASFGQTLGLISQFCF